MLGDPRLCKGGQNSGWLLKPIGSVAHNHVGISGVVTRFCWDKVSVHVVTCDTMGVCGAVRQGEGQEIGCRVELELFQGDKHICTEEGWGWEELFAMEKTPE